MMMLLDITVVRDECTVSGWVHEIDESLRGNGTLATSADGKFSIQSVYGPELEEDKLYVDGNEPGGDGQHFSYTYPTEDEATDVVCYITECLCKMGNRRTITPFCWRYIIEAPTPPDPIPPPVLPRYVRSAMYQDHVVIDRETGRVAAFGRPRGNGALADSYCRRLNAGEEMDLDWTDPLTQKETNQ